MSSPTPSRRPTERERAGLQSLDTRVQLFDLARDRTHARLEDVDPLREYRHLVAHLADGGHYPVLGVLDPQHKRREALVHRGDPIPDSFESGLDGREPTLDGPDPILDGREPTLNGPDPILDGREPILDGREPGFDSLLEPIHARFERVEPPQGSHFHGLEVLDNLLEHVVEVGPGHVLHIGTIAAYPGRRHGGLGQPIPDGTGESGRRRSLLATIAVGIDLVPQIVVQVEVPL